jgi:hypothetical protein
MKRAASLFVVVATIVFGLICAVAQGLRTDLNPITDPLSAYLGGPGSQLVRMGYYLMAANLAVFAWLCWRTATLSSGSIALLFLGGGVALIPIVGTSFGDGAFVTPSAISRATHGAAAFLAFGCITTAMMLQSHRWLQIFGRRSLTEMIIAILAAGMFVTTYSSVEWLPRGVTQKTVVLLIIVWLIWATLRRVRPAIQSVKEVV